MLETELAVLLTALSGAKRCWLADIGSAEQSAGRSRDAGCWMLVAVAGSGVSIGCKETNVSRHGFPGPRIQGPTRFSLSRQEGLGA